MWPRDLVYALYTRRLRAAVGRSTPPRHVGIVMDGNRRWARGMGFENPSVGHRYGAQHVDDLLDWCVDLGIREVTVFVLSADNVRSRPTPEVEFLMSLIEEVVTERLTRPASRWRVNLAGSLDVLPDSTARALKLARDRTADRTEGFEVTLAVGYDGRQEIVGAVRALLESAARDGVPLERLAEQVSAADIAEHLHRGAHGDVDLLIRTSGEVRISGFLPWQSANAELYFCDAFWPAFRRIDFLRALRSYSARKQHR